jgi:hypothetical protein
MLVMRMHQDWLLITILQLLLPLLVEFYKSLMPTTIEEPHVLTS